MKRKPPRLRYEIRLGDDGWWGFYAPDRCLASGFRLKATAVAWASGELENAWNYLDVRSELTIKRRDGSIQDKRTYGADPRRTRG